MLNDPFEMFKTGEVIYVEAFGSSPPLDQDQACAGSLSLAQAWQWWTVAVFPLIPWVPLLFALALKFASLRLCDEDAPTRGMSGMAFDVLIAATLLGCADAEDGEINFKLSVDNGSTGKVMNGERSEATHAYACTRCPLRPPRSPRPRRAHHTN